MYHVHRQQWPAAGEHRHRDPREGPRGECCAQRQPQLRGARACRCAGELPGQPAAGGGLCPRRYGGHRLGQGSRGQRHRRQTGVPEGNLADDQRSERCGEGKHHPRELPGDLRGSVHGRRKLAEAAGAQRRPLRLGCHQYLHRQPAILRGHGAGTCRGGRDHRGTGTGRAGRQYHHRPHQPGRGHQEGQSGGGVSAGPRSGAEGLQPVRGTPGPPRCHDAGHVRQRAAQEPAGAGRGRRRDPLPAHRRATEHLRCGHEIQGCRHTPGCTWRQGIRLWLKPRLGRQGHQPAGCEGRDRRELRTHPPQQLGRHGSGALAVQGR